MMKRILIEVLVTCLVITSCSNRQPVSTPTTFSHRENSIVTTPAMTTTATPFATGVELSLDDLKNPDMPTRIELGSDGKLTNLPDGISDEVNKDILYHYLAIINQFSKSSIYFSKDKNSGQWLLAAISPNGNMYWPTIAGNNGVKQYADDPVEYTTDSQGNIKVDNKKYEYAEVSLDGDWTFVWKGGLPQLISGKLQDSSGDVYFTEYLDKLSYVGNGNPFKDVPGIDVLYAIPTEAGSVSWWEGTSLPADQAEKMFYDYDYLKDFSSFSDTQILIGGENTPAIEGTKTDGTKVILAAEVNDAEGDLVWARVSEYKDKAGHDSFVFINPTYNAEGSVQVNEDTAKILDNWLYKALSQGQFAGNTPEGVKNSLWSQGYINLKVPTPFSAATGTGENQFVEWTTSIKWNPKLPVELMIVDSMDKYNQLIAENPSIATSLTPGWLGDEVRTEISGSCFSLGKNGHIVLVLVSTGLKGAVFNYKDIRQGLEEYDLSLQQLRQNMSDFVGSGFRRNLRHLAYLDNRQAIFEVSTEGYDHNSDPDLEKLLMTSLPTSFLEQIIK